MSAQYELTLTESGSYFFTTESGYNYFPYFTQYFLYDEDGNEHKVFHFGFERDRSYNRNKFEDKYDERIKNTIIYIVREFFRKNGESAVLYFCYEADGLSRHRSITFSKWFKELSGISLHKRNARYKEHFLYSALLVKTNNPLRKLLTNAFDNHINDMMGIQSYNFNNENYFQSSTEGKEEKS